MQSVDTSQSSFWEATYTKVSGSRFVLQALKFWA